MGELKDGGPAFPLRYGNENTGIDWTMGMSLRDYFAAHALEILLKHGTEAFPQFDDVAKEAYRFADAMLKARTEDRA